MTFVLNVCTVKGVLIGEIMHYCASPSYVGAMCPSVGFFGGTKYKMVVTVTQQEKRI